MDVRIERFQLAGGGTSWDNAHVDTAGTGQTMRINNAALTFDLSKLSGSTQSVMMEYVDMGGGANIAVNGGTVHTATVSSLPSAVGPGVVLFTTATPIAGGRRGRIILLGSIKNFTIGGQELWIDNVTARDCD